MLNKFSRIQKTLNFKWINTGEKTTFNPDRFATREDWQKSMSGSQVLVQWDPDHGPDGSKLERRAIQIGLRGEALRELSEEALIEVINLTDFVNKQRENAADDYSNLVTPQESVYNVQLCIEN